MSKVFDLEERDGAFVVRLSLSQIDMFNVTELLEEFKALIDQKQPAHIILDMSETGFIDSSGMGGLIRIHQQIKGYEGKFYITGLNPKVANLMRITRSTQYLDCFDSMDDALKAVRKNS